MKTASPALISLLSSSSSFTIADLYTFSLVGGTDLRYTTFDRDLVVGGQTFSSIGPVIERDSLRQTRGVEVDSMSVTIYARPDTIVLGLPIMQAIASGKFDGAHLLLQTLFMPTPGDTSIDPLIRFKGRVSETSNTRSRADLTVASDLEVLNAPFPKFIYQAGCLNTLYDPLCGLNKASLAVSSSTQNGCSKTKLVCSLAQASGYFSLGYVVFTSGPNNGLSRTVKSYAPGEVYLSYPLPYTPGIGEAFTIYPGCDKKQATCSSKFSNLPNFKGFPYIPKPEVLV